MKSYLFRAFLYVMLLTSITMFESCRKDNDGPCQNITCLNGGSCVNGRCDCPEGYSGSDCGRQNTPSKIRVTNIEVTRFPATEENGAGWDLLSGPDIYVDLLYNGVVVYSHKSYYKNADASLVYSFEPTINLNIDKPTDEYLIQLYDYDNPDIDDYMGGILFTPYYDGNGFPNKIVLDAGGKVAFELSVEYTW